MPWGGSRAGGGASLGKHGFPEALRFHGKKRAPGNKIGVPRQLHPPAAAPLTHSPQLMSREAELVPGLLRLCPGSKASVSHALSLIVRGRHSSGSPLQSRATALVKPSRGRGSCCGAEGQRNQGAAPTPCLLAGLPLRKREARAAHLLCSWAPKGVAACSHPRLCPSRLRAEMC